MISTKPWRTIWSSFYERLSGDLPEMDWCWYDLAFELYEERRTSVDRVLKRTLRSSTNRWDAWKQWLDETKARVDEASDFSGDRKDRLLAQLPAPPEEPPGWWETSRELLQEGSRDEAIGGAVVRVLLAEARVIRNLR